MDGIDRLRLVAVQPIDAAPLEAGHDPRVEPRRHRCVHGLARRDDGVVDDPAGQGRLVEEAGQDRRRVGRGIGAHRRPRESRTERMFGMAAVYPDAWPARVTAPLSRELG